MNLYRQSIILFGFVIPLLLIAAIVGGAFYFYSSVEATHKSKVAAFNSSETKRKTADNLEKQSTQERVKLQQWTSENGVVKSEALLALRSNLKDIEKNLPPAEFKVANFEQLANKAGFGAASAQNSSQLSLTLRGTFRAVQLALLDLETKMPQLQLQDLKITPPASTTAGSGQTSQTGSLNFQATYTAWEK
ncbi:MAG: hypothetical protein HC845_15890 [Akkermansiaceae bacterium]|nr:hypothetical protein [Akkermansiaceae bacterium]